MFQQYTIRVESPDGSSVRRDALHAELAKRRVASRIYYPCPLHLQPCFAELGYQKGRLPYAEAAANSVLSLPIYPELGERGVREVCLRFADALRAS